MGRHVGMWVGGDSLHTCR